MGAQPAWIARGAGAPLLFLHGVGGDKESWLPQLDHYAARGWRAIAWDTPGYGESPPINPYDWAGLSTALLRLVERLERAPVLVGHSMGGMIAQDFVARYPLHVRALVLAGTSPAFGNPTGEWQQRFVADRLAPLDAGKRIRDVAADLVLGMMAPGYSDAAAQAAIRAMAHVPEQTYRAAVQNLVTFDRRADLGRIAVPTLALACELDHNAPAAMMEKMAAKIPGADYVCLPGLGHLPAMEAPDAFAAALDAFLDRLP